MNARRLVGMLIPDGTNQYFSSLANQFQRLLAQRSRGWGLVVMNSDGSAPRELGYMEALMSLDIEGIVYISVGDSFDAFRKLREFRRPVLVLDREVPLENADFVLVDNSHGVELVMEHLHSLGHRRIAYVQGAMSTEPGRARDRSFREQCTKFDLPVNESLVFRGNFMFGAGTSAADQILSMAPNERPTALFASNDLMAIGAMQKLQESGIAVPDEISVIGYDDIDMASWVFPRLSTVRQDPEDIARVGVDLLVERLEAVDPEDIGEVRVKTVLPKLMKRRSCAPAP